MSFTAPVFTNAGRQLQTKGLTGTPIVFTKIGIGDGETGSQSITELEALINTVIEVDISTARRTDYSYTVGGSFTNAGMSSGFYWRELGLYAADPDYPDDRSKDILYCYQNAYTLAEYIASAASSIIEKTVRIAAMVGDAENVSATIDSSTVYVTMKELEQALDGYAAEEHEHAIEDVTGLQTALDGKAPTSHGTHVTYATAAPKSAGTAAVGTSARVAREDHVHPAQTSVSGNAGTVNGHTVNSDVPANAKFTDTVYTHPSYTARTGVPTAAQTPAFGGTFAVNQVVCDATGHVTAVTSRNVTIPSTAASASAAGLVSTGAQNFAGNKTFNGQILPNGATAYGTPQARKLASGTAAATTTNCPSGAWLGQHA